MSWTRRALTAALVATTVMAAGATLAADEPAKPERHPIEPFIGTYAGSGVSELVNGKQSKVTQRDYDVEITKDGDNFKVIWSSIDFRINDGQTNPKAQSQTVVFQPTVNGKLFKGPDADLMQGQTQYWAGIDGNSLTVYSMTISETGGYILNAWTRTVQGKNLLLAFRSTVDGTIRRTATGQLAKK
ncbi:MAG: hypothetical protein KIT36_02195 [Alphaproteobacteria bacterium]|nr:hypothetical protein [Alphaproteobacteria bacterium]